MDPIRQRLALLQFYAKYHNEPLTVASMARAYGMFWLWMLWPLALGICFIQSGVTEVGWLFIGLWAGGLHRDVKRIRQAVCVWPVMHEIVNWERIKELLKGGDKAVADLGH